MSQAANGAVSTQDSAHVSHSGKSDLFDLHGSNIADLVLNRASLRGERGVAITRMALAGLLLVRELFAYFPEIAQGAIYEMVQLGMMVFAIGFSIMVLSTDKWWIETRLRLRCLLALSTLVDTLFVAIINFSIVFYPAESHQGILYLPYMGAMVLAIIAAGLRLSRATVIINSGVNLTIFFVLLGIEQWVGNYQARYDFAFILFYLIVMVIASICAYIIASRTIHLVKLGAKQAVQAETVRERLGAYVGKDVANAALSTEEIFLGGVRQQVAVLFCDIRGFTGYAETQVPEVLMTQLNDYLEEMVGVITDREGVVDKYLGDGIMAVFGAPTSRADDARRAVQAAWGMHQALLLHNERRMMKGLPPLRHGIGVHFGPVIAGNIGTSERVQYTVVGNTVGTASQLESATKEFQVPVLLSDEVCQQALRSGSIPEVAPCGTLAIPGRESPLTVYTFAPLFLHHTDPSTRSTAGA